jgi:signal transduction histidine kinase
MKWYRKLFWKIFLVIWLISAAGTGIAVLGVLEVAERRQSLELLETRARAQASLMLERQARGEAVYGRRDKDDDDREHKHRHKERLMPLWIVDPTTGRVMLGPDASPPPPGRMVRFSVETLGGKPMQAVLVLLVSALASLLLSWLIVRPINQLCRHAQELYHHQNLSSRADNRLSARRDEIGELSREFNQMAGYVEETLTAQQRLLQDVSHELRAPLARLQVAAGLAEQKLGAGDATAQRINHECEQLDSLIAEILSLSRLDQTAVEGPPFALGELFDAIAGDVGFTQPERVLDVSVEPESLQLRANEDLLRRALDNLISNALKYTPVEAPVHLGARLTERRELLLWVRDEGPGVPEALLGRLTEPFTRGRTQQQDGFGLGLSIVRRATERLGGTLKLRNHPDGGLEAMIRLPARLIEPNRVRAG